MSEETSNTATPAASGDTAPAVTNEVKVTDQPEGEQPKVDSDAASDPAQPKDPKKVDPRQKKIAELSYQTREQQRRIDQLMGMVEKTISQPRQTDGPTPPKIEDFQTLDAYLEARDEYRDKAKATKAPAEKQPDPRYLQAVQAARDDLISAGSEKYEDFEEVVTNDSVKITPFMRDAIFELDDQEVQAEVTYYLGKNPKEALRISKLTPMRQIAEVGKLEAKLASQPAPTKRPSSAPAPITPVKGAETKSTKLTIKDSIAEHIKKRRAGLKFGA